MPETADELQPCGIYVDEEGEWYHGENRIIRREILELLFERLELSSGGIYTLQDVKGKCLLEVADTPFVISRVDLESSASGEERIMLGFKHLPKREVLDPETLLVGARNILYCRVRDGRFPARFSRPAYYQIAAFVEEAGEGLFCIKVGQKRYALGKAD